MIYLGQLQKVGTINKLNLLDSLVAEVSYTVKQEDIDNPPPSPQKERKKRWVTL